MKIAIRVDGSTQIGIGHVMRCATLAEELRNLEANVVFICRDLPAAPLSILEQNAFAVLRLPAESDKPEPTHDAKRTGDLILQTLGQADWIVVDHYGLDHTWEAQAQQFTRRLMVIDDLADRVHRCDVLLDQNLYENAGSRYEGMIPPTCQRLLGPSYALLRAEFSRARTNLRKRDGVVRKILIFFGGSDSTDQTTKALHACRAAKPEGTQVDVVVGPLNPRTKRIQSLCESLTEVTFHLQCPNMSELMNEADLAIGGGGATTWERLCMGLPSIVISVAPNQTETARTASGRGMLVYLGTDEEVSVETIARTIHAMVMDPSRLQQMGKLGCNAVDGMGRRRVAAVFVSSL